MLVVVRNYSLFDSAMLIFLKSQNRNVNTMDSARILAFGMHVPLAASMDRKIIENIARYGPPLAKNTLAYDILTRKDITLDFEDILGDANKKYDFDPRQMLEFRYGVGPKPGRLMF